MPIALLTAAAFAASIVTCFASEENCTGRAISVVDAAQPEILVNTCALTTSSGIPVALIRAYARGVDVRMVAVDIRPVTFRQASARSLRQASRFGLMPAPGWRTRKHWSWRLPVAPALCRAQSGPRS